MKRIILQHIINQSDIWDIFKVLVIFGLNFTLIRVADTDILVEP